MYGSIGKNYCKLGKDFISELQHRGPDGEGVFYDHDNKISLGHTRLSIIDLNRNSNQPIISTDGRYSITYNGEVYNYLDIKAELISLGYVFNTESDTEVLLNSFIHWGKDCVLKFRGMFAFCIYDKTARSMFLARDRLGIKPLIYTFLDDQFIFCSELKPLLKTRFISRKLSRKALNDFFKFGSVQQPNTILEDVYFLMPGHYMSVQLDLGFKIERYYDLTQSKNEKYEKLHYNEAVVLVRSELENATNLQMAADVEVGAFLSGGIDSTAVVALMKTVSSSQISTYCLGFSESTYVQDETAFASQTAKRLGCKHRNIILNNDDIKDIFDEFIDFLDQPSIDGINTFLISKEVGKDLKVALSGLGGDEIFAGYEHFKTIQNYSKRKKNIIIDALNKLNSIKPNSITNKYSLWGVNEEVSVTNLRSYYKSTQNILEVSVEDVPIGRAANLSTVKRISKIEIEQYLLNTLLRDCDVLSMANSLEIRPVLLDQKLVELVFSLPDEHKIRSGRSKKILYDSVRDIIPDDVSKRKKSGFEMPFVNWMNTELKEYFSEALNSRAAKDILRPSFLHTIKFRLNHGKLIRADWLFLVFFSWLKRYEIDL